MTIVWVSGRPKALNISPSEILSPTPGTFLEVQRAASHPYSPSRRSFLLSLKLLENAVLFWDQWLWECLLYMEVGR